MLLGMPAALLPVYPELNYNPAYVLLFRTVRRLTWLDQNY